jgi:uncharacterized protein (DUF2252 family)
VASRRQAPAPPPKIPPALLSAPSSIADSRARGRAARAQLPRSRHGRWTPGEDRPDPVDLLEEQALTRVGELVPTRYGRMLASPFAFYRGAALVMASDLSAQPHTGLNVQLCGDAHLANFGVFASPERQLLFDINDFDETLPGPWEWDVKRLAASFEIAGRERGFAPDDRRSIVESAVREYRRRIRRSVRLSTLEVWYAHVASSDILELIRAEVRHNRLGRGEARAILRDLDKARRRDSARVFSRRTRDLAGDLVFVPEPPFIVPVEDLLPAGVSRDRSDQTMRRLLRAYRRTLTHQHHPIQAFHYLHLARKVVGVGSVGTRCWLLLMMGAGEGDPLVLQAKEAQPSVLERFLGPSEFANRGQRVVVGQQLMQTASDIFLGWVRVRDLDGEMRDYYLRQYHDWKGSLDIGTMGVPSATLYAELCGAALARAHARSGDRIAIARYLGKGDGFDRAMAGFAAAYGDQNERDYKTFTEAVRTGRIEAAPDE